MEKWQQQRNGLSKISLAITLVLLSTAEPELLAAHTTTAAAAEELGPVVREDVAPVGDNEQGAPGALGEAPAGPHDVRIRHRPPVDAKKYRALKARAVSHPVAQGAEVVELGPKPSAPRVALSFVGLDRPSAANNGNEFFPPDTIVAKSNTRVLEAVNSALRLFTTTGGVLQTRDLNTFFGASLSNGFVFDPKVYFDRSAANRRFYVVALQSDFLSVSRIWLALSRSPDPASLNAANWCRYNIDGRRNVGTGDASFADYPGLGVGADALVISTNQFRFFEETFTFTIVRAFNKLVAANNASSCPTIPSFIFQPSNTVGDVTTFTLQPVQHYTSPSSFRGTTNPAYLLSTHYGSSAIYRVWQVRNVGGSSPTLCIKNVSGSFTYGLQPDAPQKNSSLLLDTGDNRVTQAAGVSNALSGVHGTLCQLGRDANESCVRVVRIIVGQSESGALTARISQQTTFGGGNGVFYFRPGIAVNAREQTAVDFHRSSSSTFLSSVWAVKNHLETARFVSPSALTTGTCPQERSNRTGDYIGAQTDPANFTSFWLAGERATTIAGECQWQTQIIKVDPQKKILPSTDLGD
ncbi:MAG TPA: hypothetical protein VGX03_17355 [Candidatus Binatia bacterium]|nr:hypothetical protein [Candidatus Binatia bacterium]